MNAETFRLIITLVLSVIIVCLTLLQGKNAGLGSAFGGGAGFQTRRGVEKWLLRLTVVCVTVFFMISVVNFLS